MNWLVKADWRKLKRLDISHQIKSLILKGQFVLTFPFLLQLLLL
jgi:hypothetical protein